MGRGTTRFPPRFGVLVDFLSPVPKCEGPGAPQFDEIVAPTQFGALREFAIPGLKIQTGGTQV
jgi:hypothetical protein